MPAPLAPMIATVSPLLDVERDAEQRLEVAVAGVDATSTSSSASATVSDLADSSPRYTARTAAQDITSCGSPSMSLRPKLIAMIRSTTASRAWTMCSIHTIATPPAWISLDLVDELEDLGLGQPAGDLVEQQHPRLGGQRPGQLEALAVEQGQRAGGDVGLVEHAGPLERVDGAASVASRRRARGAERGADEHVLEHREPLERPRDLRRAADAAPAPGVGAAAG